MTDKDDAPKDDETVYISKSGTAYRLVIKGDGGYFERAEKTREKEVSAKTRVSRKDMVYLQKGQKKSIFKQYEAEFLKNEQDNSIPNPLERAISPQEFINRAKKLTQGTNEEEGGRFYYLNSNDQIVVSSEIGKRIPNFEEPSFLEDIATNEDHVSIERGEYSLGSEPTIAIGPTPAIKPTSPELAKSIEDYAHEPEELNFEGFPDSQEGPEIPASDLEGLTNGLDISSPLNPVDSEEIVITSSSDSDDTDAIPFSDEQ